MKFQWLIYGNHRNSGNSTQYLRHLFIIEQLAEVLIRALAEPSKRHLETMAGCPNVLLLLSLVAGVRLAELEQVERTARLQSQLMFEFVARHKQIPRLTYFTCRNPASNDTGNVRATRASLNQLYAAFEAKNAQLIGSLYRDNVQRRPFVRIVMLDVLHQPRGKSGGRGVPRGWPAGGGGGGGGRWGTALGIPSSSADWLDSVLRVEALRQVVAVDLACGMLSRRFLEMVSGTDRR